MEHDLNERSPSSDDLERRRCAALELAIEHHGVSSMPVVDVAVLLTAENFLAFITTGKAPLNSRGGANVHPFLSAADGKHQ